MKRSNLISKFSFSAASALVAFAVCKANAAIGNSASAESRKKRFSMVLSQNIKGLDPAALSDRLSASAVAQIYDRLYQYSYLKRPMAIEPALASELPKLSKDRLTYTIKIKPGVYFHDSEAFPGGKGRELVAEDFVYSWRRLADPANRSEAFFVIDGKIAGLNEWANLKKDGKADYSTPIEGLKAVDRYTLQIKLVSVYPQFEFVLAGLGLAPVPREAVEKYGLEFLNHPVGTGPFMLAQASDWVRGSKMTLRRNPNYRKEFYPGTKTLIPRVDEVLIHELTEDQPRWLNGLRGNFDVFDIPTSNFQTSILNKGGADVMSDELSKLGLNLDAGPAPDVVYFGISFADPVLGGSRLLRQAIAHAIDRKAFTKKFFNGSTMVAESSVPPGIETYDPKYVNPVQTFDIAKAKQLLVEAGYPEGKGLPEFNFDALADTRSRQMGELFSQNLAVIGVKVKVTINSWPQILEKMKAQKFQFYGLGWTAIYPDPQAFFLGFTTKNLSPGPNTSSFSNPEFDKLYDVATNLPKSDKRRLKMYHQMRDIVAQEVPWIYIAHRTGYRLVQNWVKDYKYHDIELGIAKYVDVDPNLKRQ